jgi:phage gp46-like protein
MTTDLAFTDIDIAVDTDGIYDLVIDETDRDLRTVSGYETSVMCSIFSDRRAARDEIADPWRRRGWIGNLLSERPGDSYGSGIWLYEQRRGTSDVLTAIEHEARQALDWMIEDRLVLGIEAQATYNPANRIMRITMTATDDLWRNTRSKTVATNS